MEVICIVINPYPLMILFVIDKSTLITERLALLANETNDITAIHTAVSFSEAIAVLQQVQPDVVLMDMNLPVAKSLALLKTIKKENSNTSFIVLFDEVNEIKKQYCDYLGVSFILDKYHDIEKIVPAINALTSRKTVIQYP